MLEDTGFTNILTWYTSVPYVFDESLIAFRLARFYKLKEKFPNKYDEIYKAIQDFIKTKYEKKEIFLFDALCFACVKK